MREGELPRMYNISTRAPVLLWRVLEQRELLSFLPKSVAEPFLTAGVLAEIPLPKVARMPAIGFAARVEPEASAAVSLMAFLRERFKEERRAAGGRNASGSLQGEPKRKAGPG